MRFAGIWLRISQTIPKRKPARSRSPRTRQTIPNDAKAQTGAEGAKPTTNAGTSRSRSEAYRDIILSKLEQGLSSQRIFQDLVEEHGFEEKYWSVYRYISKLSQSKELPFLRLEVEPGAELQVDSGAGARTTNQQGKRAFYSVPPEYLGNDVCVRSNSHVVRILNHRLESIAIHCAKEPGGFST